MDLEQQVTIMYMTAKIHLSDVKKELAALGFRGHISYPQTFLKAERDDAYQRCYEVSYDRWGYSPVPENKQRVCRYRAVLSDESSPSSYQKRGAVLRKFKKELSRLFVIEEETKIPLKYFMSDVETEPLLSATQFSS